MKFYLNSEELDLLKELDLLDLGSSQIAPYVNSETPYLFLTGTQVLSLIKKIFDIIWMDKISYDEKYFLAYLGWRLTNDCLPFG